MKRKAHLVAAAVMAAASVATAAPASAAPLCVGTQSTVVQCVDPTGAKWVDDCVYLGAPPCTPVVVYGPYVYCIGGEIGQDLFVCEN